MTTTSQQTTRAAPSPRAAAAAEAPLNLSLAYRMERVTFPAVDQTELVGHLYLPEGVQGPVPAVVLLGPETFVKEQAPTQYAKRLANDGFAALVFDPRYSGESGGEPRRWENPPAKVEDTRTAVDYLVSRPEVDAARLAGLAICQGSSTMLRAVADDPRIKVLATAAGHYRDHQGDLLWMGGQDGYDARMSRGKDALARYESTGEVDYVPAVDPERTDVGMPGRFVNEWYAPWAAVSGWENRYAVMSDATVLEFESLSAAKRLSAPWLLIHSDNSFIPDAARRHYDAAPGREGEKKLLQWDGDTGHFQYYDDPVVMDRTASSVNAWFRRHLDMPLPASAYITY